MEGLHRGILCAPVFDSALAAGAGRHEKKQIWRSVRRLVGIDDEMPQHVGLKTRSMRRMTCFSDRVGRRDSAFKV